MSPPLRDDPPAASQRGGRRPRCWACCRISGQGDPDLKLRVVLSLLCLVLAKLANILCSPSSTSTWSTRWGPGRAR